MSYDDDWQVTTDLHADCTLEFQGTSSAAPLAAGCIALVLEAKYVISSATKFCSQFHCQY